MTTLESSSRGQEEVMELGKSLHRFHQGVARPSALVPKAHLDQRVAEIIEIIVRHCVESMFDLTTTKLLDTVRNFTNGVETFLSNGGHIPTTVALASQLREIIEHNLNLLVPLVSTKAYGPDTAQNLDAAFRDIVHGHLNQLLGSLNSMLSCGAFDPSQGPVFEPPISNSLFHDVKSPCCYLFLAKVSLDFEATHLARLLKHLKQLFSTKNCPIFEANVRNIRETIRNTASVLRGKYVDSRVQWLSTVVTRGPLNAEETKMPHKLVTVISFRSAEASWRFRRTANNTYSSLLRLLVISVHLPTCNDTTVVHAAGAEWHLYRLQNGWNLFGPARTCATPCFHKSILKLCM